MVPFCLWILALVTHEKQVAHRCWGRHRPEGDVLGDFVLRDWQIPEEGKKAKPRSQKEPLNSQRSSLHLSAARPKMVGPAILLVLAGGLALAQRSADSQMERPSSP